MLKTVEKLTIEQKLTRTSDIKSIIALALTFKKLGNESTSVNPPQFVINTMAGLGRLLGCKV